MRLPLMPRALAQKTTTTDIRATGMIVIATAMAGIEIEAAIATEIGNIATGAGTGLGRIRITTEMW